MKITTKRNKPLFYRQNWHKVQRLGQKVKRLRKWRAAKGGDSKTRLKERGKPARPTIGWGASKETFGNVKGLTPIRVETLNDFIKFTDKKMQGVIIGSVGKKKQKVLIAKANEMGIKILNRYRGEQNATK